MFLSLTTTHRPATDLGFLLHKHPGKAQAFPVAGGTAHVFYPVAEPDECTAALLLDVDPVGLVTVRDRGYLLATRSGADRTYRLSRILAAEKLDEPAQRPDRVDLDRAWQERASQFRAGGDV